MHLFVLAGEASGDRIGADLIRRLKARDAFLRVSGVGGDEMIAQGVAPLFAMSDLAVMGITDVVMRLPLLLWRVEQTARAIRRLDPDVVMLIDAQEFSRLVARRLKAMRFKRSVLLYVAPSVWARAPHRAKAYAPLFREILAVLPFEPRKLHELGGPPTVYVGHPALAEAREPAEGSSSWVALLPGSRDGEIRRHLPTMRAVAEAVTAAEPGMRLFIPALRSRAGQLRALTAHWPVPVEIIADRSARLERYGQTRLAVSVAGTATLELALACVPTVSCYVMDAHQARAYDKLGRPPVSLPNIILQEDLVPEHLAPRTEAEPVIGSALALLHDDSQRARQIAGFRRLRELMEAGEPGYGRHDPAQRVLAHVNAP